MGSPVGTGPTLPIAGPARKRDAGGTHNPSPHMDPTRSSKWGAFQTTFPLGEYHYRVPDLSIARRVDQWLTPTDLVLMAEVAQTSLTLIHE